MAAFPIYSFHHLIFHFFLIQSTIPISSLSLQTLTLTHKNPNFDPEISLFGDAKSLNDTSQVQLTCPLASSSGLVMLKNPFKFLDSKRSKPTSFSTEFTFSISPGNGDGLVFVMGPYDFGSRIVGRDSFGVLKEKKYMGIEFDTKMDANVGDLNDNHVGINMGSLVSVRVSNVSNLVLNSGEKLKSWIDYDASLKRLVVRLSKYGDKRPYNPIIAYSIDLLRMWGDEDVFVGIISTNGGNSLQTSSVYSWKFMLRKVPSSMHSMPANPRDYVDEGGESFRVHKRRVCPLRIVAGLVFATGCGVLLVFVVLFAWGAVVNRITVLPVEYHVKPVDFRYEKISVVVENDAKGVKN